MERIHATCVVIKGQGVLLRGAPGSGKSDLALRLIEDGAGLVSDDYTEVYKDADDLVGRAPDTIQGLMELRGIGIVQMPFAEDAAIRAIFDLMPLSDIDRLPDSETEMLQGVEVPRFCVHGLDASAPAKVRWALKALQENLFHSK
ncbi:HPr kinase/phosphatase C-terminal domain-containing protein [Magnetovibrio sp. PR-2]|uniref:HPr kinase/phosphorylase n=1 Tax=Magnetovibrio sp. PR-2 TaxID=3120356 RepID=UPI002FCE2277